MTSVNPLPPLLEHQIEIRVRYQETDAQGRVHHTNYFNYFEMGRIELLRASGYLYRDLEAAGILLVVTDLRCKYHLPADFDDLLTLTTETTRCRGVRIDHQYTLRRNQDLIAQAHSTVACIGRDGKIRRLPDWMTDAFHPKDV